jgi:HK97 family phage major capsid protein
MWIKLMKDWGEHKAGERINLSSADAAPLIADGTAVADNTNPVDEATAQITASVVEGLRAQLPEMVAQQVATAVATETTPTPQENKAVQPVIEVGQNREELNPTGGFASFSEFAIAVYHAGMPGGRAVVDERLLVRAPSGLEEGDDTRGGFLVPTQYLETLLRLVWEESSVYNRCTHIPMQVNSVEIPCLKNTDRREGYRSGGMQLYWVAEAAQKTSTYPTFRKVGLKLSELIGLVYVTDVLLEDSPISLEPLLGQLFAEEFALMLDDVFMNGTGAGMPLGILNAPCLTTQAAETGQAATTIVAENVINMWSRMWGPSKKRSAWFINADTIPQLMTMTINVGTGGVPVYMPANSLAGSPHGTMFGRPVIEFEMCQTLGTVGDILLADWSYYLIGQKSKAIKKATSIHIRFDYDETAFRYTLRIDGQPWLDSEITPAYGTPTQSPFVVLATRS